MFNPYWDSNATDKKKNDTTTQLTTPEGCSCVLYSRNSRVILLA